MKPGSFLLFIDNAGGGFSQLIQKAAEVNGFLILFEMRHVHYREEIFNVSRFGHHGCHATTLTIFLLQKPMNRPSNRSLVFPDCEVGIVDERTPLLHGKKVKKASSQKRLQATKLKIAQENPPSVSLIGNETSKSINHQLIEKLSPEPLQEIQFVPNNSNAVPRENFYSKTENGNAEPLPSSSISHPESKKYFSPCKGIVNPIKFQFGGFPKSVTTPEVQQTYDSKVDQKLIKTCQSNFKASSLHGISIPNYSSITPPPISVVGINSNTDEFYHSERNIPQGTLVPRSETPLSGFRNPDELFLQDKTLNANQNTKSITEYHEVDCKTPPFSDQKEKNVLHQNTWQRETKISSNFAKSDGIGATKESRANARQNVDFKESTLKVESTVTLRVSVEDVSCKGRILHTTTIPKHSPTTKQSLPGTSSFHPNQIMFRENVDGSQTSSAALDTQSYYNWSIRKTSNSKFSQERTTLSPVHKTNGDKFLPQNNLQVKSSSATLLSPPAALKQNNSKRVISQKQIIPNYSSITTQPVRITTQPVCEPSIPKRGIDESEEDICCPCWSKL